jgi:hypothetical protein
VATAATPKPLQKDELTMGNSGIFGYVNYLVEKDRKTILDTLVNGMSTRDPWAPTRATTSATS